MPGDMPYTQTVLAVDGNSDPVIFTNLVLEERMLDTGRFSFSWTPENIDNSLTAALDFKNRFLGKGIQFKFQDGSGTEKHTFKGVITGINSATSPDSHTHFLISGKGVFAQMEGVKECRSFYHKGLSDIVNAVNSGGNTSIDCRPQHSDDLYYIVQYNQTDFDFLRSLAIRYGEWMYYEGNKLIFGPKPSGSAITLAAGNDVEHLRIHSQAAKASSSSAGFDLFTGRPLTASQQAPANSSEMLQVTTRAGNDVYANAATNSYFSAAATQGLLDMANKLQQQAASASSVFISGKSVDSSVNVGSIVAITDEDDQSGKQFIVIEAVHNASATNGYHNQFVAIPVDVEVPHYTNPWVHPKAGPQPAIVKENEDNDGHDRIRVKFPWMKDGDATPWIQVLTPHAGQGKGMRFTPEKEEEVMMDFIDGNAERPIMTGAVYTAQNKSGTKTGGNNNKGLTSKSGATFSIDDSGGSITISDSGGNKVFMDGAGNIKISSSAKIELEAPEINITATSKVNISDKVVVDVGANKVTTDATNISSTATASNELKGNSNVKIESAASTEIKGQATSVSGTNVDINGTAMTNVKGGMINLN